MGTRSTTAVVLAGLTIGIAAAPVAAAPPPADPEPPSVYAADSRLALDAARIRLGLYLQDHPVDSADPRGPCPLVPTEVLANAAAAASASAAVDLRLQLEPWTAATTSEPELRPASAPRGVIAGTPVVTCSSERPADGSLARISVFALRLGDGVSFSDVVRRYGVEPALPVSSGRLGGLTAGACLETAETGVCIDVWQSRSLAIGFTLDGPAAAVNPATPDDLLTALVPGLLDSMAVVLGAPVTCNAAAIGADTGVAIDEPVCNDGWATANARPCPPPPTTEPGQGPVPEQEPPEDCPTVDVFHVTPAGWQHDGRIEAGCAEQLAPLGMTGVTATEFVPACNADARALRGGTIRPGVTGQRVGGLQIALVALGYDLPVDGRYGPITEAAVVHYQLSNGLIVDGITGRQTQGSLGI